MESNVSLQVSQQGLRSQVYHRLWYAYTYIKYKRVFFLTSFTIQLILCVWNPSSQFPIQAMASCMSGSFLPWSSALEHKAHYRYIHACMMRVRCVRMPKQNYITLSLCLFLSLPLSLSSFCLSFSISLSLSLYLPLPLSLSPLSLFCKQVAVSIVGSDFNGSATTQRASLGFVLKELTGECANSSHCDFSFDSCQWQLGTNVTTVMDGSNPLATGKEHIGSLWHQIRSSEGKFRVCSE